MSSDIVTDVVAQFADDRANDYAQQIYAEQWKVHAIDRTIDVVACIGEPFSYADVVSCVATVLIREGWEPPADRFGSVVGMRFSVNQTVRATMRDLEDASQITRIRAEAGMRPHLWVRTHSRHHYRQDGQP
jgi:hypothetical protein